MTYLMKKDTKGFKLDLFTKSSNGTKFWKNNSSVWNKSFLDYPWFSCQPKVCILSQINFFFPKEAKATSDDLRISALFSDRLLDSVNIVWEFILWCNFIRKNWELNLFYWLIFLYFSWKPSCNSFKLIKNAWFGQGTLIPGKPKEILFLHSFFRILFKPASRLPLFLREWTSHRDNKNKTFVF